MRCCYGMLLDVNSIPLAATTQILNSQLENPEPHIPSFHRIAWLTRNNSPSLKPPTLATLNSESMSNKQKMLLCLLQIRDAAEASQDEKTIANCDTILLQASLTLPNRNPKPENKHP